MYFFYILRFYFLHIFIFYGFTKAITEAIYKWFLFFKYRQCIIIAPVVRKNFLYISVFYGFIPYVFLLYFTVRRKALRFILRAVSRTYSQLEASLGRQPRRHFRGDFLCTSFVFYSSIEAVTEAIHRWFHFSSTASV